MSKFYGCKTNPNHQTSTMWMRLSYNNPSKQAILIQSFSSCTVMKSFTFDVLCICRPVESDMLGEMAGMSIIGTIGNHLQRFPLDSKKVLGSNLRTLGPFWVKFACSPIHAYRRTLRVHWLLHIVQKHACWDNWWFLNDLRSEYENVWLFVSFVSVLAMWWTGDPSREYPELDSLENWMDLGMIVKIVRKWPFNPSQIGQGQPLR